jgi:hypothetical protein
MAVQNRPLFRFVLQRTGRRLTEDRANVGDGGRGRTTSCGGRHTASCERLERSATNACSSLRLSTLRFEIRHRLLACR